MIRPSLVLILLLSAVVMMRGVASDWRRNAVEPTEPATKKTAVPSTAPAPVPPAKPVQPPVSATLPDLKVGYVFNQERMLASAEQMEAAKGSDLEGQISGEGGITANVDDIVYAGSIITDAFSRALVLYSAQPAGGSAQPMSRSSRFQAPEKQAGGQEHARLEVGDKIGGYQVAEILPDKLILTKGDETVEKLLFDPEKKRDAPPPRPSAGPVSSGGGPPRPPTPGGVLSTTIGGGGTSAPTAVTSGGSGVPAPPPTPPPAPKTMPPTTQTVSPTAGTATGTATTPVRRMVISRQTMSAPDTSRVMRPSRLGDEGGMPPGFDPSKLMGTGTPPTPGRN